MIRVFAAVVGIALAAGWLAGLGPAQQPPASGKAAVKISPDDRWQLMNVLQAGPPVTRDSYVASLRLGTKRYAILNVEFKTAQACTDFKADGAYVFSRNGEFADVFMDRVSAFVALEKHPEVVWIDMAGEVVAPPPDPGVPGEKSRDLPEEVVRDGLGKLTGKGVIVAVVDSGIDFHHPDFVRYESDGQPTSRLLYYWDTMAEGPVKGLPGRAAPVSYPNGTSIGTVYSQQELTAELRAKERRIAVWDTGGHGTACASIAAGNGNGHKEFRAERVGVAPQADLIAVRIGGAGGGLANAYLLNCICDWIDGVAAGQNEPVVVSCSFGGTESPRDGSRVEERRLAKRFPPEARGRAICIAAGNDGREAIHAEAEFGGDKDRRELAWVARRGGLLVVYCATDDPDDVVVSGVDAKYVQTFYHPLARAVVCEVDITASRRDEQRRYVPDKLQLSTKSGKRVRADAYIPPAVGSFTDACASYGKQIDTPGCAGCAITVGSYDWNSKFHRRGEFLDYDVQALQDGSVRFVPLKVGGLSAYSNPGPSRDGKVMKPDVVAPGQWWPAAAPLNVDAYRDTSGRYRLFNGTSAATPYTAGVVALMMEKKPTITAGEIKELLHANASKDYLGARDNGDPAKNPGWGYGKLDAKAVRKVIDAIR